MKQTDQYITKRCPFKNEQSDPKNIIIFEDQPSSRACDFYWNSIICKFFVGIYIMKLKMKSAKKTKPDSELPKNQTLSTQHPPIKKPSHRKLKKTLEGITQSSSKGQKKLTSYFDMNSSSFFVETTPEEEEEPNPHKIKEQIKKQHEIIEKLAMQKQIIENRYSTLYLQTKSYKSKAKSVVFEVMREKSRIERKEMGAIDDKLGYYSQKGEFLLGTFFTQINNQIESKNRELKKIDEQLLRAKSNESRDEILFRRTFIKKESKDLEKRVKMRERELEDYKKRLKLHLDEQKCHYSTLNWPIIQQKYLCMKLLKSTPNQQTYKCFDAQQSRYVILKRITPSKSVSKQQPTQLQKYLTHLLKIRHDNIIQVLDVIQTTGDGIEYVEQLCYGRNLEEYLEKEQCLDESETKNIMRQIVEVMKFVQESCEERVCFGLELSEIMYYCGSVKMEILIEPNSCLAEEKVDEQGDQRQKREREIQLMKRMAQIMYTLLYGITDPQTLPKQKKPNKINKKLHKISDQLITLLQKWLHLDNTTQQTYQNEQYFYT